MSKYHIITAMVSTGVEIRDVKVEDIPDVRNLYSTWWVDAEGTEEVDQIDFFTELVARSINDANAEERYVVATDQNGTLVGIVGYQESPARILAPFATTEKALQLVVLMVHKAYARKGIGRALLNHLEAFAASKAFTEILLSSSERFKDSWSFYRKIGYRDLGEMPNAHGWHTRIFSKTIEKQ